MWITSMAGLFATTSATLVQILRGGGSSAITFARFLTLHTHIVLKWAAPRCSPWSSVPLLHTDRGCECLLLGTEGDGSSCLQLQPSAVWLLGSRYYWPLGWYAETLRSSYPSLASVRRCGCYDSSFDSCHRSVSKHTQNCGVTWRPSGTLTITTL